MTNHTDRELNQTINEVESIHLHFLKSMRYSDHEAAILTLATITHHQNGTKP